MDAALQQSDWKITEHFSYPYPDLQPNSTVVILDELSSPLLSTVSDEQWQAIKHLISHRCQLLWVTEGSQFRVTKPNNSLVHGLFRTVRAEDPSLSLTTLDVEFGKGPATISAVDRVLWGLKMQLESEFVERGGVIYVNRILPDNLINEFKTNESRGADPVVTSLHDLLSLLMVRRRLSSCQSDQLYVSSAYEVTYLISSLVV